MYEPILVHAPDVHRPGMALMGFAGNFLPRRIQVFGESETAFLSTLDAEGQRAAVKRVLDLDPPVLIGAHQFDNAGLAVAALRALGFGETACRAALSDAIWPARMQRLTRGPLAGRMPQGTTLWLDGGHNAAAGKALAAVVADLAARTPTPLWLITGMLDTKSAEDFLRPLAPHVTGAITVAIPDTVAAIPAGELARRAQTAGLISQPADSVAEALDTILAESSEAPLRVLICGSLYLAGAVLQENA